MLQHVWGLAGLIAENIFGYMGTVGEESASGTAGEAQNRSNADALSSSLLVCLLVPWSLCFLFYFSGPPSGPATLWSCAVVVFLLCQSMLC